MRPEASNWRRKPKGSNSWVLPEYRLRPRGKRERVPDFTPLAKTAAKSATHEHRSVGLQIRWGSRLQEQPRRYRSIRLQIRWGSRLQNQPRRTKECRTPDPLGVIRMQNQPCYYRSIGLQDAGVPDSRLMDNRIRGQGQFEVTG